MSREAEFLAMVLVFALTFVVGTAVLGGGRR